MFKGISFFCEVKKGSYLFLGLCLFNIPRLGYRDVGAKRFLLFCWEDEQGKIIYSVSYISQGHKCISVNEQEIFKLCFPLNVPALRDFINKDLPLYPFSSQELKKLVNIAEFAEMTYEQDKETPQDECKRFVWLYKHS